MVACWWHVEVGGKNEVVRAAGFDSIRAERTVSVAPRRAVRRAGVPRVDLEGGSDRFHRRATTVETCRGGRAGGRAVARDASTVPSMRRRFLRRCRRRRPSPWLTMHRRCSLPQVLKVTRVLKMHKASQYIVESGTSDEMKVDSVWDQVRKLFFSLFCLFFVATGIVFAIESNQARRRRRRSSRARGACCRGRRPLPSAVGLARSFLLRPLRPPACARACRGRPVRRSSGTTLTRTVWTAVSNRRSRDRSRTPATTTTTATRPASSSGTMRSTTS